MLKLTVRDGEGFELRQGGQLLGFVWFSRDKRRNAVLFDLPEVLVLRRKREEISEPEEDYPLAGDTICEDPDCLGLDGCVENQIDN